MIPVVAVAAAVCGAGVGTRVGPWAARHGAPAASRTRRAAHALVTAALFAAVVAWATGTAAEPFAPAHAVLLVAWLWLAAVSVVLCAVDLAVHRLPDAIVLPAAGVAAVLLALCAALGRAWSDLAWALAGALLLGGFYLLLRVAGRGGMGGGDVKLAVLLGLYLGFAGPAALVVGALAGFVLGGVFGLALVALRRAGARTAIAFGPWMIAGAWVGLVAGPALGAWYLGAPA